MRQLAKFIVALGAFTVILLAVRAFAFAIYSVPMDVAPTLHKGDRVVVNKVSHATFKRGDLMVFNQPGRLIGAVEAVPGDTITVDSATYRIPYRCCRRCTCRNCKLYLVNTGQSRVLVHLHQVEGKATRLYHLPW